MEDMKYTFETVEDDYKKIWLESTYGEGEIMIIPDKTYGLMPDCLLSCDEAKKIWVPASVQIIAPNVFSGFDPDVTIYCEVEEQPEGWFYKETGMGVSGFGADMSFEVLVDSWQGSYRYICDSDDNVSFINKETAKVKFGCKKEDMND